MIDSLAVGSSLSCLYPQHGKRNILCTQEGVIQDVGSTVKNGAFVKIQRGDGSYRNLSLKKMVIK